jgi:hypothetical protein
VIASPVIAIVLGQTDDFQDGTVQGWAGGSNPTNVPTGGPAGSGDAYVDIDSFGFNLGTFNTLQWSGDYDAETVESVEMNLDNFGPDPVSLRIVLFTPGCNFGGTACTAWTSTNATVLPSGSGWVVVSFSLAEVDLTRVLGADTHTASLQNVERLLIRHDDGTPDPPGVGTIVDTGLGIDNVTALPEPALLPSLLVGCAGLAALRRRRLAAGA